MIVACISLCCVMCVCLLMQSVLHSCKSPLKLCASSVYKLYIYIERESDVTMDDVQLNGTTPSQTLCKEQHILAKLTNWNIFWPQSQILRLSFRLLEYIFFCKSLFVNHI